MFEPNIASGGNICENFRLYSSIKNGNLWVFTHRALNIYFPYTLYYQRYLSCWEGILPNLLLGCLAKSFLQGNYFSSTLLKLLTWLLSGTLVVPNRLFQPYWCYVNSFLPETWTRSFFDCLSAINCVLIFLNIESYPFWVGSKTPRIGILLLVLFVRFWHPHGGFGMDGEYGSSVKFWLVTFIALGVLFGSKIWSPWLMGFCLGAAICSRPTVFMIWFFCWQSWWKRWRIRHKLESKPLACGQSMLIHWFNRYWVVNL